ncbi:hypothetical protein AN214_02459 [Pseudoalteromonas sp. P1-9]|nr:hypothetical protein AN214_02459 [Pseudoalteromonas sp. P1-9]
MSIPDLKGQQDYFIKYANIVSINVYYLPLTPLFKFGPYITTYFSLTDILNVSHGVHIFNTKNSESLIAFLKARGVKVKYRIARWPVIYILLFPLFFYAFVAGIKLVLRSLIMYLNKQSTVIINAVC